MDISKIISITGKPGLYKLVSQKGKTFIVEDLLKGKKTSLSAQHNVSLLENIAIYTHTEELPLADVFQKIFDKEKASNCINHKSSEKELREYMTEVLPDYDADRVYYSDLKKLFQWYNILLDNNYLVEEKKEKTKEKSPKKSKEPNAKNA